MKSPERLLLVVAGTVLAIIIAIFVVTAICIHLGLPVWLIFMVILAACLGIVIAAFWILENTDDL